MATPVTRVRVSSLFGGPVDNDAEQLMATLQRLAAGLPIFQVNFSRSGSVAVDALGHVPATA